SRSSRCRRGCTNKFAHLTAAHLSRSRLYGILDLGYVERGRASDVAEALMTGGVDLLQLRAKNYPAREIVNVAGELREITARHGVPLIINDHPEIARELQAEGLHLGQDDVSIAEARGIVGADCAVGKSTHNIDQAIRQSMRAAPNKSSFTDLWLPISDFRLCPSSSLVPSRWTP